MARTWVFRLIALVVIPAVFFISCELLLRSAGVGYPAAFVEPAIDRPGHLVDNYKFAWRFFPRAAARSSQPVLITRDKPATTKRIIVFGGSAAMGYPEPAYGFPRVLEAMLELKYPDQDFEVVNAAVTAINSHVVLPIVKDCRRLDADAWVVYMGNNEVVGPFGAAAAFGGRETPRWLIRTGLGMRRTRLGQLLAGEWGAGDVPQSWGGMEMFVDHHLRHDDPALARVYDHFRGNLSDILNVAVDQNTPVVISTVVTNQRDCGPFVSLHRRSLSHDRLARWQALFEQGVAAQGSNQFEEAATDFEQAAMIDSEFAELQFRLGRSLLELGRADEARRPLRLARDFDVLRFRADTTINEIIVAASADRQAMGVHFIDAAAKFDEQSPDGVTGDNFLHEHVHLNFSGAYLLARFFAEKLVKILELPAAGDWPSEEDCAERLGLSTHHRYLIALEMRGLFQSPPFDRQADREARDAKLALELFRLDAERTPEAARAAVARHHRLIEQYPDDWVLKRQLAVLLESTGDFTAAAQQWTEITTQLPHYSEGFYRLGALWNKAKRWSDAEPALRQAISLRPQFARALNSLGICLSHQGRFKESYEQFQAAVALDPSYAEAYVNWGLVAANQRDSQTAEKLFLAAVDADADHLPAHVHLGKQYVRAGRHGEAEKHYEAVVRLRPDDAAALTNLGMLYIRTGKPAEAVQQLERAVELDPSGQVAIRALAQAREMLLQK